MELKQILANKESLQTISSQPSGTDPRTRSVRDGKIKKAKQDLADMYDSYRQNVYTKSIAILSLGEFSESFNEVAEKDFGCYRVNGMGIFEEIADKIDKAHYENIAATSNLFEIVSNLFEETASLLSNKWINIYGTIFRCGVYVYVDNCFTWCNNCRTNNEFNSCGLVNSITRVNK